MQSPFLSVNRIFRPFLDVILNVKWEMFGTQIDTLFQHLNILHTQTLYEAYVLHCSNFIFLKDIALILLALTFS